MAAPAVVPHLRSARDVRAFLTRVTFGLAAVGAVLSRRVAPLTAAVCHELLLAGEAGGAAHLVAEVAAWQRFLTDFAAFWSRLVAVDALVSRRSAAAFLGDELHARRTAARVAGQSTLVAAALVYLLARAAAGRLDLAAPDRWIELGNTARTVERLPRVHLARFARARVAEVVALVDAARERLLARDQAEVDAGRVRHPLLDWAADLRAPVLLAAFELVAWLCASEVSDRVELGRIVAHFGE